LIINQKTTTKKAKSVVVIGKTEKKYNRHALGGPAMPDF
jgi:hypothetical protein